VSRPSIHHEHDDFSGRLPALAVDLLRAAGPKPARAIQNNAEYDMDAAFAASPIKRQRRTKEQIARFEEQIIKILREDHPQSIRHVFYRMTDPRLEQPVEKSDKGYDQVQRALKKLRENGRVPYAWITDHSRQGYHTPTFDSLADFIRWAQQYYRGNVWRDSECYVEIWSESRSTASVVLLDCQELAVSLYPCGGFAGNNYVWSAAQQINRRCKGTDRRVVIFFIGDLDPAGVWIDTSLESELRKHLHSSIHLDFVRIAILPHQVELLGLPEKPRKPGDKRVPHLQGTVEAEAMPAHVMRALLRHFVEDLLPDGALEAVRIAEESEQRYLQTWADMLDGNGAGGTA
jgi:hypothetical protein